MSGSIYPQFPYEVLFRSTQYALIDNVCREYTFLSHFFRYSLSSPFPSSPPFPPLLPSSSLFFPILPFSSLSSLFLPSSSLFSPLLCSSSLFFPFLPYYFLFSILLPSSSLISHADGLLPSSLIFFPLPFSTFLRLRISKIPLRLFTRFVT